MESAHAESTPVMALLEPAPAVTSAKVGIPEIFQYVCTAIVLACSWWLQINSIFEL